MVLASAHPVHSVLRAASGHLAEQDQEVQGPKVAVPTTRDQTLIGRIRDLVQDSRVFQDLGVHPVVDPDLVDHLAARVGPVAFSVAIVMPRIILVWRARIWYPERNWQTLLR